MSEFLTLSGWTQPADAIARALLPQAATFDYSDYTTVDAAIEALGAQHGHTRHVVAWSMGGQLLMRAIPAGALTPSHVTLIAPPFEFVHAMHGMDTFTFTQFHTNYMKDAARSKMRFHGLIAKGDRHHKRIMADLAHHHEVENTARWLPWLEDLGRTGLHHFTWTAIPKTQLIHGANDVIVPVAQAQLYAQKFPEIQVEIWEDCGHAPHLHAPEILRARILEHHGL
jgi:pimeloyl-[acyl-carrier protein] methyl ester esterase